MTDQILPPTMAGLERNVGHIRTAPDLAKAKALMKASGVKTPVSAVVRHAQRRSRVRRARPGASAEPEADRHQPRIKGAADAVNNGIIDQPEEQIASGINEWSQDYPDAEDFIEVLLDPRQAGLLPRLAPTSRRQGDDSLLQPIDALVGMRVTPPPGSTRR